MQLEEIIYHIILHEPKKHLESLAYLVPHLYIEIIFNRYLYQVSFKRSINNFTQICFSSTSIFELILQFSQIIIKINQTNNYKPMYHDALFTTNHTQRRQKIYLVIPGGGENEINLNENAAKG